MGILEESMLATAPGGLTPLFYGRFIDDVFGIWTHGEDTLLQFFDHANSCHRDIAFTYEYGISFPYLDNRATIANSQIVTDLYEKPTNTHQYLLPTSNHPPHICKNLPYGLGLRLRVIISEQETLELRLKELSAFLTARGYSEGLVAKQFDRVHQKSREALLNTNRERAPVAHHEQKRTPLVCRWSSLLPPLQPLLKSAFPILAANERTKELFDLLIVAYKRPKNLRDLLVHTRPPRTARDKNTANGTRQCGSARCKTCAMVQDIQEIQFADQPGHREVIRGKFTCASTNVVYLLTCTACQAAYVGETGCTLRERMNGHRSAIKNGEDTPVADHFKEEHSVRVSVLTSTPEEVVQRSLIERAWIRRLSGEGSPWTLINRDAGIYVEPLD